MTATTLLEAHQRFAAALDELRRNSVAEFDRWLTSAPDLAASQGEADEKIATARSKFVDEFLDQRAPPIIRTFNREAEYDILHALRSYEARPAPRSRRATPISASPWRANVWRIAVAAAFGAVAVVILLALQPIGEAPGAPAVMISRDTMVLWLLAAAFSAALGAAIGVFIVACPPVPVLLARAGLRGAPLFLARKLGALFALLRAGPLITLTAVLLGALFALIAWLLGGSKPLHVLIGLAAITVMLTARWTAPDPDKLDRDGLRRRLVARLDQDLQSDADVWAALAAALVLKRNDGSARMSTDVREITNIILARRTQQEAAEDILQVIEQHLGLPCGPTATQPQAVMSEFVWKPEHAQDYAPFGAVDAGDVVRVSSQPLYIEDASGTKRVSQKGVVTRKR